MFLRNCWYLAAWAGEVSEGGMLARRIADEHLLFLRDKQGNAFALADTCPHRLVPLSRGSCAEGTVTCAYHGLRFAANGRCVENPHGPITSALTVRSFACEERHAALWLWLGDDAPDPALIPDFSFIDRTPAPARVAGHIHSRADYRLMIDKIMDLTHADYLHAASLGGGINTRAKMVASEDDGVVTIEWSALDDDLGPLHAESVGSEDGKGDFLNRVFWRAPGNMLQQIVLSAPGAIETAPADRTCHVMTPETETTTHYFFCHTSDAVTANPKIAPAVKEALLHAFVGEDSPMLVAQTERLAGRGFWEARPALLPSDKGAVLARRALDRMIRHERERTGA